MKISKISSISRGGIDRRGPGEIVIPVYFTLQHEGEWFAPADADDFVDYVRENIHAPEPVEDHSAKDDFVDLLANTDMDADEHAYSILRCVPIQEVIDAMKSLGHLDSLDGAALFASEYLDTWEENYYEEDCDGA